MSDATDPRPSAAGAGTAFLTLSKMMLGEQTLDETLAAIAAVARDAVPGIDDVSVTMMDGDEARTVVFTGPLASQLDERQYAAGFGPCMDAARTGQTILMETDGDDLAYPDFSRSARRSGVTQVLSVGLPVPRRILGALNLYAASGHRLAGPEVEVAETLAAFAAVAVANATHVDSVANLDGRLQAALESRNVIEQAKGVLMATHRYSAAGAFAALLGDAHEHHRTLRDTAQSTVDGVQRAESA
jgi:GAF domain-containing protein